MRFVFDERFAEGFFHESPCRRVMGQRLQPFSYWHKVQLEYVQSKFLTGETPGLWDAWVAARVCASQYPVNAQFRPKYSSLWYLGWYLRYGWRSLPAAVKAIQEHISDFASGPKLWAGSGGSKMRLAEAYAALAEATGDASLMQKAAQAEHDANLEKGNRDIDDSIEQVAIFMKHGGRTAEEAWNMPMGALLWYNACFLKMEGAEVPIWSPMDEAYFEQHKRQRHEKILGIAKEIREANPLLTPQLAYATASVQYWEGVVEAQAKAM